MVREGNQRPEEGGWQWGQSLENPVLSEQVLMSSGQEKGTIS